MYIQFKGDADVGQFLLDKVLDYLEEVLGERPKGRFACYSSGDESQPVLYDPYCQSNSYIHYDIHVKHGDKRFFFGNLMIHRRMEEYRQAKYHRYYSKSDLLEELERVFDEINSSGANLEYSRVQ